MHTMKRRWRYIYVSWVLLLSALNGRADNECPKIKTLTTNCTDEYNTGKCLKLPSLNDDTKRCQEQAIATKDKNTFAFVNENNLRIHVIGHEPWKYIETKKYKPLLVVRHQGELAVEKIPPGYQVVYVKQISLHLLSV